VSDTLYHYCHTESAYSILTTRKLRLSALSFSNDRLEGRWAVQELCQRLRDGGMPEVTIETVQKTYDKLTDMRLTLGFCMSKNGDLLSQWRGYANDGRGVALGFSKASLQNSLSNESNKGERRLFDVNYQKGVHSDTMRRAAEKLLVIPRDKATGKFLQDEGRSAELQVLGLLIMQSSQAMKNPAFSEEQEVRLTSSLLKLPQNVEKVTPYSNLQDCNFHCLGGAIKPYIEHHFELGDITNIVLGPQHETPLEIVESFLRSIKSPAKVTMSAASYRSN
jgi:hypothetical protein